MDCQLQIGCTCRQSRERKRKNKTLSVSLRVKNSEWSLSWLSWQETPNPSISTTTSNTSWVLRLSLKCSQNHSKEEWLRQPRSKNIQSTRNLFRWNSWNKWGAPKAWLSSLRPPHLIQTLPLCSKLCLPKSKCFTKKVLIVACWTNSCKKSTLSSGVTRSSKSLRMIKRLRGRV